MKTSPIQERLIILRTIKTGDSHLIVHGLNPLGAQVHLVARGALASRRRFVGGLLEPTHYILAQYQPPRSYSSQEAPLHTLQEAELINSFKGLRLSFERIETGLIFVKLMSQFAQPGVEDSPELFNLLGHALMAAESSPCLDLLHLHFEIKLLHAMGVLRTENLFYPFLRCSIKEHASIHLHAEDLSRAKMEVKTLLSRYLKGLNLDFF